VSRAAQTNESQRTTTHSNAHLLHHGSLILRNGNKVKDLDKQPRSQVNVLNKSLSSDATSSLGKCINNRMRYSSLSAHGFPAKPTPNSVLGSSADAHAIKSDANLTTAAQFDAVPSSKSSMRLLDRSTNSNFGSRVKPSTCRCNTSHPFRHCSLQITNFGQTFAIRLLPSARNFKFLSSSKFSMREIKFCSNTQQARGQNTCRFTIPNVVSTSFTIHAAGTVP
jgi:hypothetical protein